VLEFAREHALGLVIAGLLHAVLLAALIVNLPGRPAVPEVGTRAPVQAVAVSEADLRAAERRRTEAREAELRRQRAEVERQRQAELQQQREREEAEQRVRAEAEQRAQAEREAREQRAAEEQRRVDEARRAEEARKAEQVRREAEARRKAEEVARAEAARKAAEERAQAQRQAELAAQIDSEQRRMRLQESTEYNAWLGSIQDQVARNWNRPPSARPGLECEVRVGLIPGMQVVNAEILRCNGDDAVRRSIIAAVERASPLPRPSDPSLFERTIVFVFKPQD
jgi:colicin import membrane protein